MKKVKFASGFRRVLGAWDVVYQGKLVEYDGYRWQVGVEEGEYPLLLEDLIYYYPVVIKHLGLEGKEVAVSIPAETYLKDKDVLVVLKEKLKKEAGVKAIVYPQGIIALAGMDNVRGHILVVDGGFNTVNAAVVEMGKKEGVTVKWLKTYYNEFGIRDLLEKYFREELLRKFPEVPANFQMLLNVFLRGYVDSGFKRVDVEKEREISIKIFMDVLLRRLKGDVFRAGKEIEKIVVVGGLGYLMKELELDSNKEIHIPEEPEFANAKGMHTASGLPAVDFGFGHVKAVLTE